jgi:hypothetical protein
VTTKTEWRIECVTRNRPRTVWPPDRESAILWVKTLQADIDTSQVKLYVRTVTVEDWNEVPS